MGCEIYNNTIDNNARSFDLTIQRGGKALVYNNAMNWIDGTDQKVWEEYLDSDQPPATNSAGQPQHISDSYYWNNPSAAHIPGIVADEYTVSYPPPLNRVVPLENYDFWVHKASFDGRLASVSAFSRPAPHPA